MATQPKTTYTYDDLRAFPVDNIRREIIGGALIVSPSPSTRHQRVAGRLLRLLLEYEDVHGGAAFTAPLDVYFGHADVVEPDVMFVTAENLRKIETPFIRGAPDIVIEISSPSTRRLELQRKLALYEQHEVPEYWYVDLDADRIEVYRLAGGVYGTPALIGRKDTLTSDIVPGFVARVDDVLGEPEPFGKES